MSDWGRYIQPVSIDFEEALRPPSLCDDIDARIKDCQAAAANWAVRMMHGVPFDNVFSGLPWKSNEDALTAWTGALHYWEEKRDATRGA